MKPGVTLLVLTMLAPACAARTKDRPVRDLSAMQAERTAEKLVARGIAFARAGDLTRAEQYLAAALDARGNPQSVLPPLLRVCIAAGHHRVALQYAVPELQRNPDDVRLRFVVAELRSLTGDTAGAVADLQAVVASQPESSAPHYAFGRLLRDEVGDRVGADREFRAYLRLEPNGVHAKESSASLLQAVRESESQKTSPPEESR